MKEEETIMKSIEYYEDAAMGYFKGLKKLVVGIKSVNDLIDQRYALSTLTTEIIKNTERINALNMLLAALSYDKISASLSGEK